MKRKEFLLLTSQAFIGILFSNSFLLNCNLNKLDINDILGKPINSLNNLTTEYFGKFSCFSLTNFQYKINGEKAFIFCDGNTIIGISIKSKKNFIENIKIPENSTKIYDNAFGTKIAWKENRIFKSINSPKEYSNIESYFFYNESLKNDKSFIW